MADSQILSATSYQPSATSYLITKNGQGSCPHLITQITRPILDLHGVGNGILWILLAWETGIRRIGKRTAEIDPVGHLDHDLARNAIAGTLFGDGIDSKNLAGTVTAVREKNINGIATDIAVAVREADHQFRSIGSSPRIALFYNGLGEPLKGNNRFVRIVRRLGTAQDDPN